MNTKLTITTMLASMFLATGTFPAFAEDICSAFRAAAGTAAEIEAAIADKVAQAEKTTAEAEKAKAHAEKAKANAKEAAAERAAAEKAASGKAALAEELRQSNPEVADLIATALEASAEADKAATEAQKATGASESPL